MLRRRAGEAKPGAHLFQDRPAMASTGTAPKPRPLSPHLDVYRMTLTMAMSIVHRITGVGLYLGVLLLAWFLLALSGDGTSYAAFTGFIHSIVGRVVLFGFTWALFHHLLGGVRHAIWDAGLGFEHPMRERLAQGTLIGSVALTLIAWIIGYAVR
jgi:succinate dehydrogenase / fumarate reductase, cytochrome b subunit